MLRRDFLKYLSSIPFVGNLFAQGESGASEGQPEDTQYDIDAWLKECGDMCAEKLGWPAGSIKFTRTEKDKRICNIDTSKAKAELPVWRKIKRIQDIDTSKVKKTLPDIQWFTHGDRELKPGQVWKGKCLTSFEPKLEFYYVLLSCDKGEYGWTWWKASMSMFGHYGGPVHNFLAEEIHQLEYVGHITELSDKMK